jgi:hypothetical protein
MPISDYYRIVIFYNIEEGRLIFGMDDNDGGGASFDYDAKLSHHVDGWCSQSDMQRKNILKRHSMIRISPI